MFKPAASIVSDDSSRVLIGLSQCNVRRIRRTLHGTVCQFIVIEIEGSLPSWVPRARVDAQRGSSWRYNPTSPAWADSEEGKSDDWTISRARGDCDRDLVLWREARSVVQPASKSAEEGEEGRPRSSHERPPSDDSEAEVFAGGAWGTGAGSSDGRTAGRGGGRAPHST